MQHSITEFQTTPTTAAPAAPPPQPHLLNTFRMVGQFASIPMAARELGVTDDAVWQQIQELETLLGCQLIHKADETCALSDAGRGIFAAVSSLVESYENPTDVVDPATILGPALNVQLDVPGIAAALKAHTDELFAFPNQLNFAQAAPNTAADIVLYMATKPRHDLESVVLFAEETIAIAATNYGVPEGGFSGTELELEPLLNFDSPIETMNWDHWFADDQDWQSHRLQAAGYQNYAIYLRAVMAGRGVGLGLAPLVAPLIAAGQLQVASPRRVQGAGACFVGVNPKTQQPEAAVEFCHILQNIWHGIP